MAVYKISYSRIEYQNNQLSQTIPLGSVLVGELNYNQNINRLERFGKERGINTLTMDDEMLAIDTEEFTVKTGFDYDAMQEVTRTAWEFVSAETL